MGTFGNLITNIQAHYNRLEIVTDGRTPFRFLPVWLLLSETTIKKKPADASPLLGGQLLQCILTGTNYPFTVYHSILTRIRAGEEINRIKAAIIKAVLIKNYYEREVTTVALNEQSSNKPYVLGRLFAVLERLQENANGSATIRSRYFASASANPGNVFPTLLKLSVHHTEKLDNAVFFEKLMTELLGRLDDVQPFPPVLNLESQGMFILGYYHQRQVFFTKKDKGEEPGNE
jgi:CRISPR-associated protein Csd1